MIIQKKIQSDLADAVKSKDKEKVSFLKVVINEFCIVASRLPNNPDKILSDDLALKELRKMNQNAIECGNDFEIEILKEYLPQMLDKTQTHDIIKDIINSLGSNNIGQIMGELRKNPNASKIDNKLASEIIRELLK